MRKTVLIEEFRLEINIDRDLPGGQASAVRRTLDGKRFRSRLGRKIRELFREYAALRPVRIRITR